MQTAPTPTCTRPALKPMTLPCPRCGEASASISLELFRLGEGEELHCHDCDADFSLDEVRELIARWTRVVAWIDTVPQGEE